MLLMSCVVLERYLFDNKRVGRSGSMVRVRLGGWRGY